MEHYVNLLTTMIGLFIETGKNKRHTESVMNDETILKFEVCIHFALKAKKMAVLTCVHKCIV